MWLTYKNFKNTESFEEWTPDGFSGSHQKHPERKHKRRYKDDSEFHHKAARQIYENAASKSEGDGVPYDRQLSILKGKMSFVQFGKAYPAVGNIEKKRANQYIRSSDFRPMCLVDVQQYIEDRHPDIWEEETQTYSVLVCEGTGSIHFLLKGGIQRQVHGDQLAWDHTYASTPR
jgi:hypothetical protein